MSIVTPLLESTKLELEIDRLMADLQNQDSHTEEYANIMNQIEKLYALKELESPKRLSPDTLVMVAGNLIGIIMILGYERVNVITSKAIGFVTKLR